MHNDSFMLQAFVFLLSAVIAVPLAKRIGLGSVMGYLCAGAVIGPFGLGLMGDDVESLMSFAEFGVVLMLFLIGLELDPSVLWRMRVSVLGLGGLQVVVTTLVFFLAGIALDFSWQVSLAVGSILSLSSTAIVLQTLEEKSLLKTEAGQSSFSVLLFQDIAVIPLLAILPLLAMDSPALANKADHVPGWETALKVILVVAAIVFVGRLVSRYLFRIIAETRMRETFTATALMLVVGIALLMNTVGLSPALGTFVAGVVLANSEYRHELESEIEPFKGLLLALFFISVGASIDFEFLLAHPWLISGLLLALIFGKMLVLVILGWLFRLSGKSNSVFTFGLAQGGEFAFVLFSFAQDNRVLSSDITAPLTVVVALSMVATPLLMNINERWVLPKLSGNVGQPDVPDEIDTHDARAIVVGFGRFGQIVGRMLRISGFNITILDHDAVQIDTVRKFGHKVFFGDASRPDLLVSAGIEEAELLVIAIDDHNRAVDLVKLVKRHFPHIRVLARARGRHQAVDLIRAGADHVERETFYSALMLGRSALQALGFRAYQARRSAELFRHYDELMLQEMVESPDDEKTRLNIARQNGRDLQDLMQTDMLSEVENQEQNWDRS
ncbi:MAG: potassium transporter [Oceanospirillaceae bacterium]|uniref:monovalent cation:proton antiporter-2 (CPA2) family protein n=1 Tax=unclassified Thalassolituus TaxID=2624967 RepID=UPI000C3F98E8|nr:MULTISPECIES: monovalent cation:proton antiporter-2 (CPA2) family protein [unclassified Thalassolituus]MAS24468.1 potassium transporter [Oceanospirillaceae bacterium]MAX98219.1 potassium transporter [Oceanospirillaceae bacterium]MBL34532.1 potassium transporter [Oceanospirillaceae bacterium]MBS54203.1 potassium transporter [Oceanospirillaceae bacterium]